MVTTTTGAAGDIAEIRARLDLYDVHRVTGGATFKSGPVYAQTNDYTDHDTKVRYLSRVELTVYGTATFKDRTDSGARVEIRYDFHSGTVRAWCKADAWNGRSFAELPAGARDKIAGAVLAACGDVYWPAIAVEAWEAAQDGDRAKLAGDLERARVALERWQAVPVPAIPAVSRCVHGGELEQCDGVTR